MMESTFENLHAPKPWGLFEHYCDWNEKLISTWETYDDAWCAYQEQYTAEEREELGVEIARWDADTNTWTMDY